MADNVDITPGSGATVAADLIAAALHQRVKISVGADGEAADLDSGQATMAASLPVVLASDQSDVKVTLDSEAVVLGAGTAEIGKLAAGTAEIGKLAAGTANIGDVDVLSVIPGVAATNLGKAEDAAHTSEDVGVMALAVRQDSMAALAGATGDYIPLTTDANGQARVLVGCPDIVVTITPTCDTNAYASGDLIFDSTAITAAVRANGGTAILQSLTLLDKADQGVALTLVFANAETDFGTLNGAPDPDDTEAATVIGHLAIAANDYVDLGASKVACLRNIGLLLQAGAATTSLYVAAINGTGTPTFGASDLVLQLGFLRS